MAWLDKNYRLNTDRAYLWHKSFDFRFFRLSKPDAVERVLVSKEGVVPKLQQIHEFIAASR